VQDADDHEADLLSEEPKKKIRAESEVDLETDSSLVVDISDALSEQDKVKYTVHTKVCMHQLLSPGLYTNPMLQQLSMEKILLLC